MSGKEKDRKKKGRIEGERKRELLLDGQFATETVLMKEFYLVRLTFDLTVLSRPTVGVNPPSLRAEHNSMRKAPF